MRRGLLVLLVGILASGLVVSGCGGDDDTSSDALTKQQFVERADAICDKTEKRQVKLMEGFNPTNAASEETELQLLEIAGLPPVSTQAEELAALTPPEELEDEVNAMLVALKGAIKKAEEKPVLVTSPETTPFLESGQMAAELGLTSCGHP